MMEIVMEHLSKLNFLLCYHNFGSVRLSLMMLMMFTMCSYSAAANCDRKSEDIRPGASVSPITSDPGPSLPHHCVCPGSWDLLRANSRNSRVYYLTTLLLSAVRCGEWEIVAISFLFREIETWGDVNQSGQITAGFLVPSSRPHPVAIK